MLYVGNPDPSIIRWISKHQATNSSGWLAVRSAAGGHQVSEVEDCCTNRRSGLVDGVRQKALLGMVNLCDQIEEISRLKEEVAQSVDVYLLWRLIVNLQEAG